MCDCNQFIDFDKASDVFVGTVVKIEYDEGSDEKKITLKVKKHYKESHAQFLDGELFEVTSLITVCGYFWNVSESYLVFVEKTEDGSRVVNMCSLTTKINFEFNDDGEWIGTPSGTDVRNWKLHLKTGNEWIKE